MPAGRPRSDNPRTNIERIRTTDAEHAQLLAGAAADGSPLGPWLREVTLKAAKRATARQQRRAPDQH